MRMNLRLLAVLAFVPIYALIGAVMGFTISWLLFQIFNIIIKTQYFTHDRIFIISIICSIVASLFFAIGYLRTDKPS